MIFLTVKVYGFAWYYVDPLEYCDANTSIVFCVYGEESHSVSPYYNDSADFSSVTLYRK